ncbi:MAG: 4Fe-4S binding protein [Actinobacteria bacterium]|nr:4Fe-4S binding protein [Actinomycetota bacterium]MBU1942525.1 4Fe-4S binding protein [Actinomycetota bacterium]MBU2687253.1 4Fe-4S binding protein [Actinomycetota bacterium]
MRTRRWTQIAGTLVANPWFAYFGTRTIYQGSAKGVCLPGFNCYACPLALFSCPIGALQHSMVLIRPGATAGAGDRLLGAVRQASSVPVSALLYVAGFIGLIGIAVGRLLCGWFCPFGFLQDLLYKIPGPKLRLPRWMRYGKYFALFVLAMLIPFITGVHWYSRLCPAGSLEGAIPLQLLPPKGGLPPTGWFFWLKIGILVAFLAWMVVTKRPFCRTACPLGAAWALCSPISLHRMYVDRTACNECQACLKACPVDIEIFEDPGSPECIRCMECKKACPQGAVTSGFLWNRARGEHGCLPAE